MILKLAHTIAIANTLFKTQCLDTRYMATTLAEHTYPIDSATLKEPQIGIVRMVEEVEG